MCLGTSLVVQGLGLHACIAGDVGSIPGRGTKIPQAAQLGQEKKKKNKNKNGFVNQLSEIWQISPMKRKFQAVT